MRAPRRKTKNKKKTTKHWHVDEDGKLKEEITTQNNLS